MRFKSSVPSQDKMTEVFYNLCSSFNTPRSLAAWLMFKYGEHEQLCSLNINPGSYMDSWSFFKDYQATKYLSKYKGLATGIDTKEVAIRKFNDSELSCKQANTRIREARLRGFPPRVASVIFYAQRKIASLIACPGPVDWTWLDLFDRSKWGPGVTFSLKGEEASLDRKIGEVPISVTRSALPFLKAVIESDPHWGSAMLHADVEGPYSLTQECFKVVGGCRVTTVDKDAKTDRTIAIEPTGNVFLQLGIGRFLRRKLLRVGINLDDQSVNQQLAYQASKSDELATVDLSSASDSISKELVFELFPVDWAILLDSVRSPCALLNGDWLKLEKFSSMGNGFTFELETVIFWALASGVLEALGIPGTVVVYGDDIILPSSAYALLQEVFHEVGFTINLEKSYARGYFRESCGKHYWDGVEVTPVYQKEELPTLDSIYRGANRLLRLAYRLGGGCGWHSALRTAVAAMIRGENIRHFIPWYSLTPKGEVICQIEDVGLISPMRVVLQHCIHSYQPGSPNWGIRLRVLSYRSKRRKVHNERALLAYWLRFTPSEALDEFKMSRAPREVQDSSFNGMVPVRRRGRYVERTRNFSLSTTTDVAWL